MASISQRNVTLDIFTWLNSTLTPSVGLETHPDEQIKLANTTFMFTATILSVVGTGGNALVLTCLVRERQLRTMANCIIGHLAFVNCLYSAIFLPSMAAMYSKFSQFACIIQVVVGVTLFMISLHSQLVISFSRYMLITKSTEVYQKWFSAKIVGALLAIFWCFDIIVYTLVPGILVQWEPLYLPVYATCFWTPPGYFNVTIPSVACVSFATALVFYVALIVHIRKKSVAIGLRTRKDIKASMTLLVVMILYFVTYNILPGILTVLHDYNMSFQAWTNGFVHFLQGVNVCVSPTLYGFSIREFKRAFRKMIPSFMRVTPNTVDSMG